MHLNTPYNGKLFLEFSFRILGDKLTFWNLNLNLCDFFQDSVFGLCNESSPLLPSYIPKGLKILLNLCFSNCTVSINHLVLLLKCRCWFRFWICKQITLGLKHFSEDKLVLVSSPTSSFSWIRLFARLLSSVVIHKALPYSTWCSKKVVHCEEYWVSKKDTSAWVQALPLPIMWHWVRRKKEKKRKEKERKGKKKKKKKKEISSVCV